MDRPSPKEEREEHQRSKEAKHSSGGAKSLRNGDCSDTGRPSSRCLVKREDDDQYKRAVNKLVPHFQQEQVHAMVQTLDKYAREAKQ